MLHAAACALPLLAVAGAADAQAGVLVRGVSGEAHCSPGGEHTTIGGSCDAATDCEPGRACVNLDGVGSRCIDPETEIVCVPGAGGCDGCPMNMTTGADPEECRVVVLADGTYSLCLYSTSLVCLAENSFGFDALLCLPITENEPSIAEGDCDGDGAPNAEDTCLCEPGTGPSCSILPPLDGGSGELDAGAPDAGARDAATPDAAARPDGSAPPPCCRSSAAEEGAPAARRAPPRAGRACSPCSWRPPSPPAGAARAAARAVDTGRAGPARRLGHNPAPCASPPSSGRTSRPPSRTIRTR
ncbi:MAG: hypothetical protein M5U28_47430 [Sandaracinaceae bacterium]|nr:hypothetical protein [Sandaracinaceae bacterium]